MDTQTALEGERTGRAVAMCPPHTAGSEGRRAPRVGAVPAGPPPQLRLSQGCMRGSPSPALQHPRLLSQCQASMVAPGSPRAPVPLSLHSLSQKTSCTSLFGTYFLHHPDLHTLHLRTDFWLVLAKMLLGLILQGTPVDRLLMKSTFIQWLQLDLDSGLQ